MSGFHRFSVANRTDFELFSGRFNRYCGFLVVHTLNLNGCGDFES